MDFTSKWRKKLGLDRVRLTYSSLRRMALYILGAFVFLSFIVSKFFTAKTPAYFVTQARSDYQQAEIELMQYLQKRPAKKELWRTLVDLRAAFEQRGDNKLLKKALGDDQFISQLIVEQKSSIDFDTFLDFIKKAQSPSPAALKARLFVSMDGISLKSLDIDGKLEVADVLMRKGEVERALKFYQQIATADPQNREAHEGVYTCLSLLNKTEEIEQLLNDDEWRKFASHETRFQYHLARREYARMFYHLTMQQYEWFSFKVMAACLAAGFCWVVFLVHLANGWSWRKREIALVFGALILGILSAKFCLGVVVVQDDFIGHAEKNKTMAYNLAYYVLGVGLREEFCKMLLFTPLLLWLKKERQTYKILTYCSLVGLGFAVEENISYFMRNTDSSVLLSRFLTANFFHMFLTSYICYYLTIAVQRGGKAWDEFTVVFIKMVIAHGVYDFLIADPTMASGGFSFFAMMLLVWLSMQYIALIVQTAPPRHRYVSVTRVFSICLCVAVGINLLVISTDVGLQAGLKAMFGGLLNSALFAYMFFRGFNEPVGH